MTGIFLDRDGVIIRKAPEGEYVADWSAVEFLPGALQAIARLCRYGHTVIIVTNQRGVATGKIKLSSLDEIHERMKGAIANCGGSVAGIYFCPHDTSEACQCRKPMPGMLLQAAREHKLPLAECWMIGDTTTDIAAGKTAGCKTALITQFRKPEESNDGPDLCGRSLAQVAEKILALQSTLKAEPFSEGNGLVIS